MIIQLTQGFITEIDDIDADLISYNWHYCNGYARRRILKSELGYPGRVGLHQIILERKLGRPVENNKEPDHMDRDGLNNHRDNLREKTRSENIKNTAIPRVSMSGYTGVYRNHQNWSVQAMICGKLIYLGTYLTKEEAHEIRENYIMEHWGL